MYRRLGQRLAIALLGLAGSQSIACGGNSSSGGGGSSRGNGAGATASGCLYNGVHYDRGESFGACNECSCEKDGVACLAIACAGGGGGMPAGNAGHGPVAGMSGSAGAGVGGDASIGGAAGAGMPSELGCEFEGVHYGSGESWQVACNRCWCESDQIACTLVRCDGAGGASLGGMGGVTLGGMGGVTSLGGASPGGTGGGGVGGVPPDSSDCDVSVGELCIVGTPTDGGQQFVTGMPLTITVRAAGCHSSSCTTLESASCNYIGSSGEYYIGVFMCLGTAGDACTDDCGGAPLVTCDPRLTLAAGDYKLSFSSATGAPLSPLEFTVPSTLSDAERCTRASF